ncbi:MAG: alpha/beta hydrolase, partial [Candidatus Moraniibacteriota bacterium]
MCRRKKTKFLFAFLFATFLALATFHCGNFFSIFKAKADNPFDYFDAEGYEYIDGGEVVWGKGEHIIEKGLFIQNGGTLKLDAGAKVLFRNSADTRVAIFLWGGKIIALGTQAERVTFSSTITDGIFSLSFEPDEDSEPSFFRYTDFIGTKINGEPEIYRDPSVDASSANTIVNLFNYKRGKVHIENSTFQNKGVSVDSRISENHNPTGFIEIVNSNFELENYAVAISSKLTCEQLSAIDCKKRVFLKNNWYGGSAGPREAPDYTLGNERIYGTYYLASFKRKKLISDPAIIVPGIMGSAKIGLEWELDPILHTYDNLVNSLEKNGYEAGVNLFGFGYNWENNNGTSAHYLQSRIEGIIADTRVSKVDVVAHSMGGLVARAYIEDLNSIDYENTIDQLITLGTPNAGAPKTYLHWEAGEGFFSVSDQFTKYHFQQEAKHSGYDDLFRYIQEKVPSVQELLPISNYLINAQNGSMKNYPNDYPRNSFLEELNLDSNLEKMQKVNYINIIGKLSSNN